MAKRFSECSCSEAKRAIIIDFEGKNQAIKRTTLIKYYSVHGGLSGREALMSIVVGCLIQNTNPLRNL